MGGILWINSLSSAQVHSWKSINNGSYKHIFLPSICCKWRRGSFTRHKEIKCDEMRDCTWVEWISWGKYFLLPVSFFKTVRSDRNGMPCNETVSFLTKKVDKNPRKATTNKLNVFDFKLTDQSKSIDSGCFSSTIENDEEKNDDDWSIQKLDINSIGNDTNLFSENFNNKFSERNKIFQIKMYPKEEVLWEDNLKKYAGCSLWWVFLKGGDQQYLIFLN